MQATIRLQGLRFYAYHGVFEEEKILGKPYELDVEVVADVTAAASTDQLEDTQDYGMLYQICEEEMAIPSKLLEHVLQRIITRIQQELETTEVTCTLSKLNPPVNGTCARSSVTMKA